MSSTNGHAESAIKPHSESAALQTLRSYNILVSLQDRELDAITKLATRTGKTPASLKNSWLHYFGEMRTAVGTELLVKKSTEMGLSLLKNLVDIHNGSIEVESKEGEHPPSCFLN